MKKLLILMACMFIINSAKSQSIQDLEGTWVGSYFCSLGKTGLRLKISAVSLTDGTFKGSFEFYPINSNKNCGIMELGIYNFNGVYKSKDDISFQFDSWVFKPNGWTYVDKNGGFKGKNKLAGKMLSETCGNFNVKRVKIK
jgi:hypothetical protein